MSPSVPTPSFISSVSAFLGGPERSYTIYTWTGVALFAVLATVLRSTLSNASYDAIPAIGNTGFFSSYISAWKAVKHAPEMIQEGYDKYKSSIFRIPEMNRWHLLISDAKLIEELRKAPDEVLSNNEAVRDSLATDYTLGRNLTKNLYHIPIIRAQLTRNLGVLYTDVRDEIVQAFEDNIPATDGWTRVKAFDAMTQIVARTSNRIFVGLPKCRDPEYTELSIQFTVYAALGGQILYLFPEFLKPLATLLLTNIPKALRTGVKHLGPIIEERQRKIDEYGLDYPDKPNDLLSWLMDEAEGEERSPTSLTRRMLTINFAAIHTSSMSFTHALYNLAMYPKYMAPLRAEIEGVVAEEGWNKVALTRMRKLDSFMKESQRATGLGVVSMQRKAMQPFTFSNGLQVPKGAIISASTMLHGDEQLYPHADEFDGFRFSDMREEEGEGTKNQLVATSADYITFGHGRHACPGRFFAANELKTMMAHLVLTYDVKLVNEGVRPADECFGTGRIPNRTAELLFRKRQE